MTWQNNMTSSTPAASASTATKTPSATAAVDLTQVLPQTPERVMGSESGHAPDIDTVDDDEALMAILAHESAARIDSSSAAAGEFIGHAMPLWPLKPCDLTRSFAAATAGAGASAGSSVILTTSPIVATKAKPAFQPLPPAKAHIEGAQMYIDVSKWAPAL